VVRSGVKVCGLAIPDLHTAGVRAGKHREEPDTFDPPSLTTRSSDCERVASFLLPPMSKKRPRRSRAQVWQKTPREVTR